jgi:hypothetical protein
MNRLLRIASALDIEGEHRMADELDRIVMSQTGYYPPPSPEEEEEQPPVEKIDEGPSLGGTNGEPPLYGDPNKRPNELIKPLRRKPKYTILKRISPDKCR